MPTAAAHAASAPRGAGTGASGVRMGAARRGAWDATKPHFLTRRAAWVPSSLWCTASTARTLVLVHHDLCVAAGASALARAARPPAPRGLHAGLLAWRVGRNMGLADLGRDELHDAHGADPHGQEDVVTHFEPLAVVLHAAHDCGAVLCVAGMPVVQALGLPVLHARVRLGHLDFEAARAGVYRCALGRSRLVAVRDLTPNLLPDPVVAEELVQGGTHHEVHLLHGGPLSR
mmetsp:Transcript_60932/g.168919  ORF Transcript_60932/g.168919 Transcript_60932/m.168919 type:complete len:231 (+) Transcript_60932:497-1189(+)